MIKNEKRDNQLKKIAYAKIRAKLANKYGIDYETGKFINSKEIEDTIFIEGSHEANVESINIVNDAIDKLVAVEEPEYKPKEKRNLRKIIKRNFKDLAIGFSILFTVGNLTYYSVKGLDHLGEERRLSNVTETVSENLKEVVEDATVKSGDNIFYVEYDKIADYIQNCSNPDLALFTLYRDYDRDNGNGTKEYRNLAEKVSKKLTFVDGSGNDHTYMTFLQYVSGDYIGNQEAGALLDRYYDDCKYELLQGDDLVLQQLPLKVKKLTLSSADAKETY